MPSIIEKPSQFLAAIALALSNSALGINVGSHEDFTDVGEQPWVLITIERDAPGCPASDGRIAHVLTISLQVIAQAMQAGSGLAACDLASALKDLATDNRWGLPKDQCDLPLNLDAIPSILIRETRQYPTWTLSFSQALYLGPLLLDDPLGTPKFACTWEVSNIDDPDQYKELEG
ncbi:hypothetical protein KW846_28250 [Pseudomonas sp. PDM32]|uniref:hypothetical protein n=1 Tax=Pseudomonas sp. PDM32 TaxID=2854768 RepID=UPI001C45FD56|nr:hypothetical protein [Pseudomonas sp. PDM32]MBV7576616.1 hypothetical protein [Pseudomonas sp. PDM32]